MRTLKAQNWQPKYELRQEYLNAVTVKMLVDSGPEVSLSQRNYGGI
jgi:hypothetical protein